MFLGFGFLFSPIIALFKFIPLVGYFIAHAIAIVTWIFSFVISIILTLLTIAVAWIWYRPLFGILLLVGVGAGIAVLCIGK